MKKLVKFSKTNLFSTNSTRFLKNETECEVRKAILCPLCEIIRMCGDTGILSVI